MSNATKVLTELVVKGETVNLYGVKIQRNIFDFKKLVGNFDFGTYNNNDSSTSIRVSGIPKQEDLPKLDLRNDIINNTKAKCITGTKEDEADKTLTADFNNLNHLRLRDGDEDQEEDDDEVSKVKKEISI
ncbi:hypothetical protein INT45_000027 [Circinella minor]|uniref:Uncharacterized protein n=1 Tax=Circinella minor TaxID=1195481 RepID=A0A8H7RW30_9FUNG|nr:hypothetical protein INT45_000027 [Circinella minor]